MSMKNSNDTIRIELASFQLVAQCLHQPRHRVTPTTRLEVQEVLAYCTPFVQQQKKYSNGALSYLRRRIVMCLATPTTMYLILLYALTLHLGIKPVSIRMHNNQRTPIFRYVVLITVQNAQFWASQKRITREQCTWRSRGGGRGKREGVSWKFKMPVPMYRSVICNFLLALIHTIRSCNLAQLRGTSCIYECVSPLR